jgi:hypothetical protein
MEKEVEQSHAPEVKVVNAVRFWSIQILVWAFMMLLIAVYLVFFAGQEIWSDGWSS